MHIAQYLHRQPGDRFRLSIRRARTEGERHAVIEAPRGLGLETEPRGPEGWARWLAGGHPGGWR